MANNKNDLGTAPVKKLMAQMAVPALVAQLVNLLYNIVDRIYIGHIPEIGGAALTGVGLFTPILMLITAFAMMAGSGGAPRAAIAMGAGHKERAEKIMGNCFTILLIFAVVLTAVFYFACPTLLRWFGASDATLPYALEYGRIYILGCVFVLITMGMNVFITTQGFAKISMLTTVIGAAINIVLDPILIFGFGMGVQGAAIATVASQAVSAVWILRFLTGKQTVLKLKLENMPLVGNIILPCLGLGISTFVMLSTESILSVSFTSSLARYGGDTAVGAMTVLTSINQLITMPLSGICQGGQPLISFNYGAKKLDRVKEAFFCQFGVCVAYTTVFWLLLMFMPNVFAGIFTDNAALVEYAAWALRIFLACGFSVGFQISCQQSFMALGQAKISLVMALLRKVVLLIPLIFILPNFFADKALAVFLAEPVSDVIAAAVTTLMFFRFFFKMLKENAAQQQ
ncbi:MAG: MATE family efflux transporter [Oscillospiraceae bacterium]|nr:MATE family efflux transporter [Oscillospiraceae bacterium]